MEKGFLILKTYQKKQGQRTDAVIDPLSEMAPHCTSSEHCFFRQVFFLLWDDLVFIIPFLRPTFIIDQIKTHSALDGFMTRMIGKASRNFGEKFLC